jgi:predicted nucleic acid-binding protein
VQAELEVGTSQGFTVPNPDQISWIHVIPVQSQTLIPIVTDLGAGEAETIGLALEHPGSRVILDDQLGRRVAAINHIKYTGTLGVVLKAKQTGKLNAVKPIIGALRAAGLWMDNDLENLILSQAGE